MAEVTIKPTTPRSSQRGNQSTIKALIIIGALIFLASAGAWWFLVRNTAQNSFDSMLNNNFRTASVTREVQQISGTQKLDQVIRIQNQSQHVASGLTTLTQNNGATKVITESIGTPTADFVRYIEIKTDQKNQKGKQLEFGSVLNIWGKSESDPGGQIGSLYGDVSLGLFPFADLSAEQRNQMMDIINTNKVYQTDFNTTQRIVKDGRPYFIYRVNVKPSAYVTMLKQYGEYVGIDQLKNLNPEDYKDTPDQVVDVAVDILSQRLAKVTTVKGNRQESYSGYGIIQKIELPNNAVPMQELQERLQTSASA